MSWKRIVSDKTHQQNQVDIFKGIRGEPIPPEKVVPVKKKDKKKDRRNVKQQIRRGDFDD